MVFGKNANMKRHRKDRYKITIVGHFGLGKELINGQTIKTKTIYTELSNIYGLNQVNILDTSGGFKRIISLFFKLRKAFSQSTNIIILPAHNGVKFFVPLCSHFNRRFHKSIHYIVIGGWLPSLLDKKRKMLKPLLDFDGIYVETNTLIKKLNVLKLNNIFLMKNFKNVRILSSNSLHFQKEAPFRLCTFSRVMKEKGIEDIVDTIININSYFGKTVYTLDIYGPVDEWQQDWFNELSSRFSKDIVYRGSIAYDKSIETIKDYYLLIFPTRFYTEGIPGTIIDSYCAGVPVVASKWESSLDVIENGKTGFLYEYGNNKALLECLMGLLDSNVVNSIKERCLLKAKEFSATEAVSKLLLR